MAHKIKNTFKGLDTDTSINKYSNDKYYDARNIRILTNDSLTSGAISNFPRPDIEISYGGSGRKVLGTTMVRDTLVVFCVHESSGESLILKSEEGNANFILVYSDINSDTKLEFNVDNPIRGVGRYESETVQKVYWCDGLNPNSYINIADTYDMGVGTSYEATLFRLTPNSELHSPIPQEVISGGSLESGIIYYTYQLYRNYGSETSMSSSSFGVPLSSRNGSELNEFRGDEVGVNTGQSVEVEFNNLDSDFDRIKIYSLLFTDIDADPVINLISDREYTGDTLTIIDSGAISLESLTTTEFLGMGGRVFSSETLETKYNYLFPGNIKESRSDIDFDARAYRYKIQQLDGVVGVGNDVITTGLFFRATFPSGLKELGNSIYATITPNESTPINLTVAAKTYEELDELIYTFETPDPGGVWDDPTNLEFGEGEVVYHSGILYRSLVDHINIEPGTNPTYWHVFFDPASSTVISDGAGIYSQIETVGGAQTNIYPGDDLTLIAENHDAINQFNNFEKDLEWFRSGERTSEDEFKYNSGGSIIGGSGLNISYLFTTESIAANRQTASSVALRDILTKDDSFLNPILAGKYKGYKRNEVYRFGIEFIFKNGQKSFVKWIGDIRFPTMGDEPLTTDAPNSVDNEQLGLFLTVNLTYFEANYPEEYASLSGIKVVRAKRTDLDKNILYQGLSGPYQYVPWDNADDPSTYGSYSVIPNSTDIRKGLIAVEDTDYPGSIGTAVEVDLSDNLYEFNSPDLIIGGSISHRSSDSVYYAGALEINRHTDSPHATGGSNEQPYFNERNYADRGVYNFGLKQEVNNITESKLNFDGSTNNGHSYFSSETLNNRTIMWRSSGDDDGIRDKHLVLDLDTSPAFKTKVGNLLPPAWLTSRTYKLHDIVANPGLSIYYRSLVSNNQGNLPSSSPAEWQEVNIEKDTFIGDYVRNKFGSQYGGNSYSARQLTSFIPTVCKITTGEVVEFIPISEFDNVNKEADLRVFGGDTYVSNFDYMRTTSDREAPHSSGYTMQEYITFPVETPYNLDYRRDEIIKYFTGYAEADAASNDNYKLQVTKEKGVTDYPTLYPDQLTDLNLYNDAYSRNNDITTNTIRPDNFQTDFTLDTMVLASNKKFNGEYIDNWTKYDFNTFLEIDSSYGPINVLKNYNNKLFYFQDNGFGVLAVEDREQISANSGIPLTLGTGAVLERYDYVSTHFGCLRDEAVLATPNNLYFVDELDKSIRVISDSDLNGNLSKIKGVSHKLQSNLLASGSDYIALGFDPRHKEVLFSFDNDTIVYSELLQQFTSMYSIFADQDRSVSPDIDFKADRYSVINDELYLIAFDDDQIAITASRMDADTAYTFAEDCSITLLIHPNGNNIFTFDNLDIRSNVFDAFTESLPHDTDNVDETVQYLQFKNSYLEQNIGGGLTPPSELNRLARAWRVQVPLTDNDNRFVDSYLLVTLKYTHSGSTGDKFVLHDVTTYVRPTKNNI